MFAITKRGTLSKATVVRLSACFMSVFCNPKHCVLFQPLVFDSNHNCKRFTAMVTLEHESWKYDTVSKTV